ncbi:MAG: DUF4440 domain-containing protein [Bermanella sp.]
MTKHTRVILLLLSGLLGSSMAASKENNTEMTASNQVLQAIQTMTHAFQQKNITGVLNSYEEGAAVLFEPGQAISDPATIKQMFEGAFQINPIFDYPNGHEVYMSNDIALHIAPWVMTGQAPDGTTIEQSGLSVAVLRKQTDGQWLMVLDNPHGQVLLNK